MAGGFPGPLGATGIIILHRFSVNQLIYDFGKTPRQRGRVPGLLPPEAEEDYAGTRQQVVLDARTAYYGYLAARRALKVARKRRCARTRNS